MSHKIRTITIRDFRGYDSEQVFDLTAASGQPASLVVLYAPNGFGKTSFFDAVEWALTGQIKRFADNAVIKKSAERQRGRILHNYDSEQAGGAVEIQFAGNQILTRATKPSRSGTEQWDYNSGKLTDKSKLLAKRPLRAATAVSILTQESGDQAICFTTPEGRFDALKSFWDTHNDTNIYKSILGVHKAAAEKREALLGDIADLERLVTQELQASGLGQRMNDLIAAYNELALEEEEVEAVAEHMELTELTSRHEQVIRFKNKAAEDSTTLLDKLDKINGLFDRYNLYTSNLSYLSVLTQKRQQVEDQLLVVQQVARQQEKLAQLRKQLTAEQESLTQKYRLKSVAEDFLVIDEEIQEWTSYREETTALLQKERQLLNNSRASLLKLTTRLQQRQNEEASQEAAIRSLTQAAEVYAIYSAKAAFYAARRNLARQLVAGRNDLYEEQQRAVAAVQNFTELNRATLEQTGLTVPDALASPLLDVQRALAGLREAELQSQQAEAANTRAQDLQATLTSLRQLGRHFVAETNAAACPLCATPFADYAALQDTILGQLAASQDITTTASQVLAASQQLQSATQYFRRRLQEFNVTSRHLAQQLRERLLTRRNRLAASETLSYYYQNMLDFATRQLREVAISINIEVNSLSAEALQQLLAARQAEVREARQYSTSLAQQFRDQEEQQTTLKGSILQKEYAGEQTQLKITKARSSYPYQQALALLGEAESQAQQLASLDQRVEEAEFMIRSLEAEVTLVQTAIAQVPPQVATAKQETLTAELHATDRQLSEVTTTVSQYLEAVRSLRLPEDLDLLLALHTEQQNIEKTLPLLAQQQELLASLIAVAELMRGYLENTTSLQQKQAQLARVERKIAQLDDARQHAIAYIKAKIAGHFDEDLINELYQKIEPHPTLKHIKFVPELDGNRPGLDILVSDTIQGYDKAPVVYFSAAQVNILSLSIFLAKALRDTTAVVNTIFLDDPIQFLDSINMLSFIDLIRTIMSSEQLDRQIVISTHDENFYKLLQKKIDPSYYDAKFIELMTFGKVKSIPAA